MCCSFIVVNIPGFFFLPLSRSLTRTPLWLIHPPHGLRVVIVCFESSLSDSICYMYVCVKLSISNVPSQLDLWCADKQTQSMLLIGFKNIRPIGPDECKSISTSRVRSAVGDFNWYIYVINSGLALQTIWTYIIRTNTKRVHLMIFDQHIPDTHKHTQKAHHQLGGAPYESEPAQHHQLLTPTVCRRVWWP